MGNYINTLVAALTLTVSSLDVAAEKHYPLVLSPGQSIEAKIPNGPIKILAGEELKRTYTWDNGECERSLELHTRPKPRKGITGSYNYDTIKPGSIYPWVECNGIVRGDVVEGHVNFQNEYSFLLWLSKRYSWQGPNFFDYVVHTNDGILVGFRKNPESKNIYVDVLRIMIDGKKPESLPGSRDELINRE